MRTGLETPSSRVVLEVGMEGSGCKPEPARVEME